MKMQWVNLSRSVPGDAFYKVTGVIDKVPDNSHFHFDAFLKHVNISNYKRNME